MRILGSLFDEPGTCRNYELRLPPMLIIKKSFNWNLRKIVTCGRDSIASLWNVGVTAHHSVNTFLTCSVRGIMDREAWFSDQKFFMSCNFHQPCGTNGQRWAASRQKHSPTPSPPSSWCLGHISDLRIILTSLSNSRAEEETWHSGKAKAASGRGKSGGIGRSEVSTDSSSTSGFTWMKKITNYFRLTWSVLTSWATYKSFFIISRACVRSFSQTFEA